MGVTGACQNRELVISYSVPANTLYPAIDQLRKQRGFNDKQLKRRCILSLFGAKSMIIENNTEMCVSMYGVYDKKSKCGMALVKIYEKKVDTIAF